MKGPFQIVRKPHGIMYEHTLMLYNATVAHKISPSPIAPYWMRQRQATGNTAHFMDGAYQEFVGPVQIKPVLDPRLPRAAI